MQLNNCCFIHTESCAAFIHYVRLQWVVWRQTAAFSQITQIPDRKISNMLTEILVCIFLTFDLTCLKGKQTQSEE